MTSSTRPYTGDTMRRVAVPALLLLAELVLVAGVTALLLRPGEPERSAGPKPEPIAPFGAIPREDLVFRWAVPEDFAPVRVEVLSVHLEVIWRSGPVFEGRFAPDGRTRGELPVGDLWWRGVAVPEVGPERAGDLAAFTLVP